MSSGPRKRPPARDHMPKRSSRFHAVDHRGRVTALVAEGIDPELQAQVDAFEALSPEDQEVVTEYALAVARANALEWATANQVAAGKPEAEVPELAAAIVAAMSDLELLDQFLASVPAPGTALQHPQPPAPTMTERTTPIEPGDLAARIAHLRERQAATPEVERMTVMAVTASGEVELEMAVRWDPEATDPYARMQKDGTVPKGAFVSTLPGDNLFAMVAAGADLPQIVDDPGAAWHAILCVEGLRTDEDPGREIMPEACQFPDLPVSLRLQIHDEGGHWGAVTCGRIDEMDRVPLQGYNAIAGNGIFGTDEHGQTAQLLVTEQTQRFISIDPRAVTMEIVEIEISTSGYYDCDDPEPELYDWWLRYTELTIGAATIVATPALQQAVIALASMELPETPIAVANASTSTVTASGEPGPAGDVDLAAPPPEWFAEPAFAQGDKRLVRQADGYYACPLTVTKDRQVFGHVAYWGADHTGFPGKSRKPPHSPTYAHFMTGARATAAGTKVAVGNLTMGIGHASTKLGFEAARAHYATAHYDGGFGAIQVADVCAGEDEFGIWVAGAICEGVSDADIRKFESLGLSGDWRQIAGQLHFTACLAVPVPGFPIAREDAMTASAEIIDLQAVRAGMDAGGELTSLVAAGRVRRIPADERLAALEGQVHSLVLDRTKAAERQALLDLVG